MSSLEIDQVENAYGEAVATGKRGDDFIAALAESVNRALATQPATAPEWPSGPAAELALARRLMAERWPDPSTWDRATEVTRQEWRDSARAILVALHPDAARDAT